MFYAKYINEHRIDNNIPSTITIEGVTYNGDLLQHTDLLEQAGFLLVEEIYPEIEGEEPQDQHTEVDHYELDQEGKKILAYYIYVKNDPPPPNVYSKLKILMAAQQAGFADVLIGFIESDKTVEYIWNASNTIEENDLLKQYLPTVAQALGKTEAEIKAFLDEHCIAD